MPGLLGRIIPSAHNSLISFWNISLSPSNPVV